MGWKLEGTYFETCACEVVCPCTAALALGADYDRCRVTLVFNVTEGDAIAAITWFSDTAVFRPFGLPRTLPSL